MNFTHLIFQPGTGSKSYTLAHFESSLLPGQAVLDPAAVGHSRRHVCPAAQAGLHGGTQYSSVGADTLN